MSDYKQLSDFAATELVAASDLIYSENATTEVEQKTTVAQLQYFVLSPIATGSSTDAGTLLDTDTTPIGRAGLFQTTLAKIKAYVLSALSTGSSPTAGALTGAEIVPVSRGTGLLQTTTAAIAALAVGDLAPQRQSIPVLTAGQANYVTTGYTPGIINVFIAGVRISPSGYQATDGTNITITDPNVLAMLVPGMTIDTDAALSVSVSDVATVGSVQALDPANMPAVGTLTGAELMTVKQSGSFFQSTLTKIAQYVQSLFAPMRQSIPVTSNGQATYVTTGYTVGMIDVFVTGIRLNPVQYQALDGTNVTITDTAVLANLVTGMTVDIAAVVGLSVANAATVGSVNALIPSNQPTATTFTGTEQVSMLQGAGLVKNTLAAIGQWMLNTYLGFTQSGTGALPRTIQNKLSDVISVKDFGAVGDGVTNDANAFTLADAACVASGATLDGGGHTYAISSAITLNCGRFRNITFVPASGYTGSAPTFNVDSVVGLCLFDNVSGFNFVGSGANVRRGTFTGTPTFRTRGHCEWSNNGALLRTTLTAALNTATTFVLPVASAVGWSAGMALAVGGGYFTVQSVSLATGANTITLVNNGSAPTLVSGQTRNCASGIYVTLSQNGMNGVSVGDGTSAFSLDIPHGTLTVQNNGWFGFFAWNHSYAGVQEVCGVYAYNNGFIGLGMSWVQYGLIKDNIVLNSGDNGIDIFQATGSVTISGNVSRFNGTEGIFVGSAGDIPQIIGNDFRGNFQYAANLYARTTPTLGMVFVDNDCRDNYIYSVNTTGIQTGRIARCKLGGANTSYSLWMEGSNSGWGITKMVIEDCDFYTPASGQDIGGNFSPFGGPGVNGSVDFLDLNFFGRFPSILIYNVDTTNSRQRPDVLWTAGSASSLTAAHGSPIQVTVITYQWLNTAVVSDRVVGVTMRMSTDGSEGTSSAITGATRIVGIEVTNDLANFIGYARTSQYGYNFTNSTATVRYVTIECGGSKQTIQLTWT